MEYYVVRATKKNVEETELAHHGILGMKWGVRRFQNEDGTLTNAGRERYSDKSTKKASSGSEALSKQTREVQATKVTPEVASKMHNAANIASTVKKASGSSNNEGLVESKTGKARMDATRQAQLARRESKSGVWKPNSISGLGENDRQAHINQGDFSPWYGGSYQEIREDLSQEELLEILMKALDERILSRDSVDSVDWEYQLGDDLKFFISDADKRTRKYGIGDEPTNMERQVWNEMIDELTTNPQYKKQLDQLRGEIAVRKIETYMELGNNTPHVHRVNGTSETGKGGSNAKPNLTDKDFEALKGVSLERWKEAPVGVGSVYGSLRNAHEYEKEKEYNSKKNKR